MYGHRNFGSLQKSLEKTEEAKEFLKVLPHQYYEENNLHGLLIEQIKDYPTLIGELNRFLPCIDNWATCDLLTVRVVKKHLDTFTEEVERWLASDHTYTIRFGIGMLMRYYLEEHFSLEYPEKVVKIRSEEYYVNMMRAWYFATGSGEASMKRFFLFWRKRGWMPGRITKLSRRPLRATGSLRSRKYI